MVSRWLFAGVVAALGVQRLLELRLSRQHEARMRHMGGVEHGREHFPLMAALHTGWFAAMLVEVFAAKRPFRPALAAVSFLLLVLGQSLRYAAIHALGWRWTVRVVTVPDQPSVRHGIYRYLRHPNYLGVVLEIAAVPLLHSAYLTSALFSLANALLMRVRIPLEEQALHRVSTGNPAQTAGE